MRIERYAATLLLYALASMATAQTVQFKPAVQLKLERDDNIFRTAGGTTGVVLADTLTTVGVGAKLTLSESLQSLQLSGDYGHTDYAKLDALDYDHYRLGGQLRLALASLLRLKIDAGRDRRQENFAFRDDAENGLITVDRALAELRLLATPYWTGIASADRYQTRASRQQSRDFDLTENSGELGLEYRRNGYSYFGAALRQSEGEYPNRIVMAGDGREKDYVQQSAILRAGYIPSGLSDLTAQLAYTQRGHDDPAVRDFKGITGRIGYTRKFSGVSRLRLEVYRDLFYIEDINANYVENLGVQTQYDYDWSAKLKGLVAAEFYDSSYQGSPGLNSQGQSRQDNVLSLRVGADYQPFYRFSIRPGYRYERRGSNTRSARYDYRNYGVDFAYEYGLATTR